MANQTVTTVVNYDDDTISGLLDGETITINGGSVTIDADVRWNQQAAVFGAVTLSSSLGGSFLIDGTKVWELYFDASTGTVPVQGSLGTNGVTGGTSGATGELLRVWETGSLVPLAAGGAMPASGWIKLRSKTGTFVEDEVVTLPGGATITLTGAGKRSWVHAVGREAQTLTMPRLGTFAVEGDWYELGLTDGTDNQQFQFPVADECAGVQVETGPSTGVYEWWPNACALWTRNAAGTTAGTTGVSVLQDAISGPPGNMEGGQYYGGIRLSESTASSNHVYSATAVTNSFNPSNILFRVWVKQGTRQFAYVQAVSGSNNYGVVFDFATETVVNTRTSASATGTSHNVFNQGGGWYRIDLTIDHAVLNSTCNLNVGPCSSASPTYTSNNLPSYAAVTTENVFIAEPMILGSEATIATDERGKVCHVNGSSGLITFALRQGALEQGAKPPSGCRVRVPNVILSSAAAVDYSRNTQNITAATRYDLTTTAAGSLSFKKVACNWWTAATNPYDVLFEDCAVAVGVSVTNAASAVTLRRIVVTGSRNMSTQPVSISNCASGGTITDCTFMRTNAASSNINAQIQISANFVIERCKNYTGPPSFARYSRASHVSWSFTTVRNVEIKDCAVIGAGISATTSSQIKIKNLAYADASIGTTAVVTSMYGIALTTCSDVDIDTITPFAGLENVHPYVSMLFTTASSSNISAQNIGTPQAPYDAGTVNPMGLFATLFATTSGVTLRRLYGNNLRTAAVSTVNTIQNLRMVNVWADGADSQVMVAVDALSQGCRWTNPSTVQSSVYGTHWEDAFVSATDGRLMIVGNEPIATTADQCSFTFGLGAGFTSAGNASVPNVTDTITWTMPYFALGHNSIARFTSGVFTNPWLVTGTNPQFLEFDYQIDTGAGWSAWKHLMNQGRRSAGGLMGDTTVTLTAAERAVMLRQPQVGDYIQSANNRLPHGTTITNVVGDVLTVSNGFTASLTASEALFIWRDIADETIDPNTGYKLKVRLRVNTANPATLFSFLRIPFDTDATAQLIQYPLPVVQNIGAVTNIRAGSRLQVYNVTTATEVANEVVAGTSWQYPYDEGTDFTDGDVVRVRLARCLGPTASIGYEGLAIAGPNGWSLLAAQSDDDVYNLNGIDGTAVSEFVFDYPNVQVDISDPDGATTITRLYAWWANERTTEQGIRTLIGGLVAEDAANYKIITSRIDLKLDNNSSLGVIFTGDLRLYRDDGAAPVVSSTSGGGSITLYAGKVYTVNVGGSALTPSESAKLMGLPDAATTATAVWNKTLP